MYLGKLYFQKSDLFILLAVGILLYLRYTRAALPLFEIDNLLVLAILFLLAKAAIIPTYNPIVFLTFFTALVITLFLPLFQVILFLLFAFLIQKFLKVY